MAYEDQKQRRTAGFLHPSLQYCFQGLSIDHHRQSAMVLQAENDICRGFALWSWSHFHRWPSLDDQRAAYYRVAQHSCSLQSLICQHIFWRFHLAWTTPPDELDEDSVAAVRISHIGMHWNRDLVQSYAFPNFADILRCFVSQEQDCPSAVRPPPHCIIRLIHIQKVVTKGQDLQLQIYIVFRLPWLKSL